MLYDRWQAVLRDHSQEIALVDAARDRRWTFGELNGAAKSHALADTPVITPSGNGPEFIFAVLAAWRLGKPVMPVEGVVPELPTSLPSNIAHFKLTSGTTGASQLIGFTEEQLAADADNIVATMGLRPEQPNLGVISLAHSYGFSNLVTPLLLHGVPLVLCSSPMPEAVKAAARGHVALALPAVPAMWRAWHEAGAVPENVQLAISAGAPLPVELEATVFERCGLKIHNFYGASECGGIAYDRSDKPRTDASLVGEPMEGVSLSVADVGCLVVRSQAVGIGYLPDRDARLGDRAFHTSDLAELLDGHVLLRGRSSDVINVAGRKLSPETVEVVIRRQPGVLECLVVGVPARDAARGDEAVAIVRLEEKVQLEVIRSATSGELAAWQRPRHWWVVPEIAANQRGKVSRREWRERFLEAQAIG